MNFSRLVSLGVCTVSLGGIPRAFSQSGPSADPQSQAIRLPEVVVTAPPESLTVPSIQQADEQIHLVPGGVSLINSERYKTGRSSSIEDVLKGTPGVYIESRGGTDEVKLSIRGAGLDGTYNVRGVKLLQDGIPITQGDGDGDFQSIDPLALRYTEVYRGANALRYGATTLGGAINFVTPTGYDAPLAQARFEAGSNGYFREQVSSGDVFGPFDYFASLTGYARQGYQAHSRTDAFRLTTNFGYRPNDQFETRFFIGYVNSSLELAGALTKQEVETHPRMADPNAIAFNQQRNPEYFRLANKTTYRWDDQQIEATAFWIHRDLDHPLFWNPYYLNGLGVLDLLSNTFGGGLRYTNNADFLGTRNLLTLGFEPWVTVTEDNRFQNLHGNRGLKTADGTQTSANLDLYAENQHYLSQKLALITGLQFSVAPRDYTDDFVGNPNGNQTQNIDYYGFSPKIGLRYDFDPKTQIFANLSRSFEPPNFDELLAIGGAAGDVLSVPLQAQTATTIEIGTRGEWSRFAWDVAFYHSWIDHELLTLNDEFGNPRGTVNGGETYHQGVELGLDTTVLEGLFAKTPDAEAKPDRLVLRQVYNWSDFRFEGDPVYGGNRLPGIPEHLYRAELLYEHPCGIYFGPNIEWAFEKYAADYANTLYADAYATLGFKAGYRTPHGFSFFLEARNLTGKRYASVVEVIPDARVSAGPPRIFVPAEGRAFYAGIEWKW